MIPMYSAKIRQQLSIIIVLLTNSTAYAIDELSHRVSTTVSDKVNDYQTITVSAQNMIQDLIARVPYLIVASSVFILFWFASLLFKRAVSKILGKRDNHQNLVTVFRRVGSALILFLGFMVAMIIAVPSFTPSKLIGGLGIGSVAIGFAFKDIFQNLLSGILLLLSEPFKIGDQIISGQYEGTVEDIQIRATTIRTYDGRKVVIPNSQLYTSPTTVNTGYSQRRLEFDLSVHYDNDIASVRRVVLEQLEQAHTVSKLAEPSVIVTAVDGSSIVMRIRWFIDEGTQSNRVTSIDEVITFVKQGLDHAGIKMPTTVTYLETEHPLHVQTHLPS